jgi:hypothetical protein
VLGEVTSVATALRQLLGITKRDMSQPAAVAALIRQAQQRTA